MILCGKGCKVPKTLSSLKLGSSQKGRNSNILLGFWLRIYKFRNHGQDFLVYELFLRFFIPINWKKLTIRQNFSDLE